MYKAEFSIKLLTIVGVHRPINFSSFNKKILYSILTLFMFILIFSYYISLGAYLILHSLNDIDDFAETLCYTLAVFIACIKMINFLLKREDIIKLITILNEDCLKFRDNKEKIIQDICDYTARRNTKYFFIIILITVLTMTIGGLMNGKNNYNLPTKGSFPYNYYNQKIIFYLTYIVQSLSIYLCGTISVASETFVMTMLIQICSQLDIIYYRLQNLPHLYSNNIRSIIFNETEEEKIFKNCIVHHNCVNTFSRKLNNIFSIVFGIQFFASIVNICTFVFNLSNKNEINNRVLVQSMTLISFLFQIFLYCHFGNEVMLKSLKLANVINMMDWTVLTKNTKQGILLICLRANHPITITSGSVIPMTYDTFVKNDKLTGYGTGLALIFGGLAKGKNNINLPLKASFPYDYNQKLAFSLTYIGQCLFIHFSAFISIACATFQFFASIINICTLVFSLSNKNEINDRVIVQSMALIAFLFQLFLYCHFGNEVMLKSLKLANVMSIIDWTSLTKNTKQGLLLISLRASKPIIITSGYVIPMTYDTFFKILKTSYAAYNVLQNAT
ncbi:odorant receptor Or1-like [Leptopilina boulardi]|uniref:odorant receptor Or1-like n=1 Tax=Leptopilina boulardi TaxID=63433 RepID=UPI0021F5F88B|nr:odorant receptor Or1-like [Leptopilina boulardi]